MKRILIFNLAYYPRHVGGAEVAVKEITDRIPDIEFDMVTLRKHAPAFDKVGNINVYRVGWEWKGSRTSSSTFFPLSKYLFAFNAFFKAISLHRKNKYDAIWSIMANYAGFGAIFFKIAHPEIPFILTLQEGDPIEHIKKRVGIFYPFFKLIFTRANKIQAISTFLSNWAKDMGYKGTVEVIPNGVDLSKFAEVEERKNKTQITLITTSRLVKKNGIEDVINAIKILPENIRFQIIGTGILEKQLKSQVERLGIENRIEFLGYMDQSEIPKYLHQADIFVRPSLSEGMGNSFIEAMMAGLPVIATPVGGIPDFLRDRETGLFCEVQNSQSIADKVMEYVNNPELTSRVIDNARRMVKERYSWDLIASEMQSKVFEQI